MPELWQPAERRGSRFVTWIVNWLIKPFTMYAISSFFLFTVFKTLITPELATEYLAGAVLLGAAPCTAMVFVWSTLTKGNPLHIVLIAVPLTIQTIFIFTVAYVACKLLKLSHDIAAPAGMIGASNFFELAVAVAIALFGTISMPIRDVRSLPCLVLSLVFPLSL